MKSLLAFFNKTAIKFGMIFSILFLTLLILLNFLVVKNSHDSFVTVLEGVRYQAVANPADGTIEIKPETYNVSEFNPDGTKRSKPLEQAFTEDFQESLLRVGIIGVLASFLLGFVLSSVFTIPLNKLSKGMNKLRKNDYKIELEETGTTEIDEVVTEFNRLTKELDKIETLRKDLISDTSHELKTPLTSLLGQLEGIKDGLLKVDTCRIDLLLEQVRRLTDLIDKLQDFTRLRNKNQNIVKSRIVLLDLVKKVSEEQKKALKENNIELIVHIDKSLTVFADKNMLERVFVNLLDNAIKYSGCKTISINANKRKIIFRDNGKGVSSEHLPYIFERFYRVEKSRNRKTGGLGLGLSIVKEIVESHGWKMTVKNENGLLFEIDF